MRCIIMSALAFAAVSSILLVVGCIIGEWLRSIRHRQTAPVVIEIPLSPELHDDSCPVCDKPLGEPQDQTWATCYGKQRLVHLGCARSDYRGIGTVMCGED